MRKEMQIEEFLVAIGMTAEEFKKQKTGSWYAEFFLQDSWRVLVEFTARNFAEKFFQLPMESQRKIIAVSVDQLKKPGDVLTVVENKMSVHIIRVDTVVDGFHPIELLITR